MFIGVCRLSFHLHGNNSLKGKRSVVKKLVERTKSRFNAAVAEVGDNDEYRRAILGVAVVGNNSSHVDSMVGKITAFMEYAANASLTVMKTEVIPLGDNFKGEDYHTTGFI